MPTLAVNNWLMLDLVLVQLTIETAIHPNIDLMFLMIVWYCNNRKIFFFTCKPCNWTFPPQLYVDLRLPPEETPHQDHQHVEDDDDYEDALCQDLVYL